MSLWTYKLVKSSFTHWVPHSIFFINFKGMSLITQQKFLWVMKLIPFYKSFSEGHVPSMPHGSIPAYVPSYRLIGPLLNMYHFWHDGIILTQYDNSHGSCVWTMFIFNWNIVLSSVRPNSTLTRKLRLFRFIFNRNIGSWLNW